MVETNIFQELKESGLDREIAVLRERGVNDELAWLMIQAVLSRRVGGFPDRFIDLLDPIRRIFEIRKEAFFSIEIRGKTLESIGQVLDSLTDEQQSLLEEGIVPIITYTFNVSTHTALQRGGRRHH